jgi:tetratricopeptide (TPR) repeat protein
VLLLALLAVSVVLFLPRWVEPAGPEAEVAPASGGAGSLPARETEETSPVPPAPPEDPALEDRAEEALARATGLRESLESRRVSLWGAEGHAAALEAFARGDAALASGDYLPAAEAYEQAAEALQALEAQAPEVFLRALEEGRAALAAGEGSRAEEAFGLAVALAPGNEVARSGLKRAEVLDRVLALVREGERAEREGRFAEAEERYRSALSLDPLSPPAQQALARVRGRISDDAFARAMSEGLEALDRGELEVADEALGRAGELQPGSRQVAGARQQLEQERTLRSIVDRRERALELEAREEWRAALEQYEAILGLDATVRFAQEGRARCSERAELFESMAYHLEHPERLSSDEVLAEAMVLVEEAAALSQAGPRHERQLEALRKLLEASAAPVRVVLLSDSETEVTVYRVGRLGRFDRHALKLRPGTYTVVGQRKGYRDVRLTLVVPPGRKPEPLVVTCKERI